MSADRDWVRVAKASDLREGEGFETGVELAGTSVGLFLVDGKPYAVGECTHERGPIAQGQLDGLKVSCPWHSASFDISTGRCALGAFACRVDGSVDTGEVGEIDALPPIQTFEVKVADGEVFVRVKDPA